MKYTTLTSETWSTLIAGSPSLEPGHYMLDSTLGGFTLIPQNIDGEWHFADIGFQLTTNQIVLGNASQTFTNNAGAQVPGPVSLNENGTMFTLVNTGSGTGNEFKLLKQPIPNVTTNIVARGAWNATTNTPDVSLAANQGDGNNVFTYLISATGTQSIGGAVAQLYEVGGQITFFDQPGAGATFRYDSPGGIGAGTPLHYASLTTVLNFSATSVSSTINPGVYQVAPLSGAHILAAGTYNPNGIINTTDNTFTVVQSGLYEMIFSVSLALPDTNIRVNGVIAASTDTSGSASSEPTIMLIRNLTAGDTVEFGIGTGTTPVTIGGINITMKQLPSSTVVNPGTIVPTPITRFRMYRSSNFSFAGTQSGIVFDTVVYTTDPTAYNTGTGVYTVPVSGYYQLNAQARLDAPGGGNTNRGEVTLVIWVNGAEQMRATDFHETDDLAFGSTHGVSISGSLFLNAGDAVNVVITHPHAGTNTVTGVTGQYMTQFSGYRLPEQSIVTPGTLPVLDQTGATSGYFDLGTMRIQWGRATGSPITITLPAAFANNTYAVTATVNANVGSALGIFTYGYTTTTFVGSIKNTAGADVPTDWTWMAIGLKP